MHSQTFRTRAHFGAAHLAKSFVWSSVDLLLGYFLYAVLHIPAGEVARLLFIFLLFGAVCDALIGFAISWLRMQRRTVLLLHAVGSLATVVLLFGQFMLTSDSSQWTLPVGLAFRFAFALYDVPQTALTSLLPMNDRDARDYVRLRTTLSSVARVTVTAANLAFVQLPATVFRTGVGAALFALSAMVLVTSVGLLHNGSPSQKVAPPPRSATRIAPPRGLLSVLVAFLASTTLFATLSRLLIFSPSPPEFAHLGAWLLLAFGVGNVVGPMVAGRLLDVAGWRGACVIAGVLAALAGDLLLLMPHTVLPTAQIAAASIYGLGLGAVGMYLWDTASRVVRRHASLTGQRSDGLVFGLIIFTIQISIALSSLILGGVIDDHVRDGRSSAMTVIAVTTLGGIIVTALLISQRTVAEAA
ncbi:MAG: MFS transporter [Steroidobacteraceae bacterium]